MAGIGLSAFSVFFMQSPSFLAQQRTLVENCGRSNAGMLFAMTAVPCDNHIRQMLDGAPTDHFDAVFAHIVKDLDESGGLRSLRCLDGRVLIALDGSEHFCSRKLNCAHCSTRKRSDGQPEYFHSFVGATLVAPGHTTVVPLAELCRTDLDTARAIGTGPGYLAGVNTPERRMRLVTDALEAFAPDDLAHMQKSVAIAKEADRMEGGLRKLEQAFFTAALADRSAAGHVDVNAPLVPSGDGQ
ncbi:MAG: hypothetical protein H5U19_09115 [Rhodobacteraceae bacterium]|nr:hypothetical protein [Paracoccaceae bacterium]